MTVLRRVWAWLLTALAVIAAGAGALLLWRRYRGQKLTHQDRVEIDKARKDVAAIKAERDALDERIADYDGELAELDMQIEEGRARAAGVLRRGRPMTEQEVSDALKRFLR